MITVKIQTEKGLQDVFVEDGATVKDVLHTAGINPTPQNKIIIASEEPDEIGQEDFVEDNDILEIDESQPK